MTFEDILREQLVGKQFRLNKYAHPKHTGYFSDWVEVPPYYKGIIPTSTIGTITGLQVSYDQYDGDYTNMTVDVDGTTLNYSIGSLTDTINFI